MSPCIITRGHAGYGCYQGTCWVWLLPGDMLGMVVHFIFAVNFLIARTRAHVEATDENLFLSILSCNDRIYIFTARANVREIILS